MLHKLDAVGNITGCLPLYLYRCRLYDRCLELCRDNVRALVHCDVRLSTSYREFIQPRDDDVVFGDARAQRSDGMRMQLAGATAVNQQALTLYPLSHRANSALLLFDLRLNGREFNSQAALLSSDSGQVTHTYLA